MRTDAGEKQVNDTTKLLAGLALSLAGAASIAASTSIPSGDDDACMVGPMAQFGRYIGDWTIEDWRLSEDGSDWTKGVGAHWNFVCIRNGTAIQDFWIPSEGNVGTNLRTYNSRTDSWDIA